MIYIIRHGQTTKNKENRLQGRADDPLNATGIRQAERVRDRFLSEGITIDKVYSSPLSRAADTAKIIVGDDCPFVTDDHLLEMDYGPYEGLDLKDPPPEIVTFFSDFIHHPAPEGMEQLKDVVDRLGEFLEGIRKEAREKNILISTHAIAMKGALEYLTPRSRGEYWSQYIGNCSVFRVTSDEDGKYGTPEELFQ